MSLTMHGTQPDSLVQDDEPSMFTPEELRPFAADDAEAGRRIGKILSALFIYTLVAMSIVTWWTLRTVGH